MTLAYAKLMPALGQAAAISRRTGKPQTIVERTGLFGGRKLAVTDQPKPGDTPLVDGIADPGVSDEALAAMRLCLGSMPDETQKAVLSFARALRGTGAAAFEADELAVIVWHVACGLSNFDFAHVRPMAAVS